MPANVVGGLIDFLVAQLGVTVWDGEVPRYDTSGNPINQNASTSPSDWPVVKLYMKEPGFGRSWTTEDPYDDLGDILIQVWGTTRASVLVVLNSIEALLAQASNWALINLGGPTANPYYFISILLKTWYLGQEEGVRTSGSELLYRGDLHYEVDVHGAVSTA